MKSEVIKTYLGVPSILPGDQTNQGAEHPPGIVALFVELQNTPHGFRGESSGETALVRLDTLVEVVEALGELSKNLPLSGRLLILHRLLAELGHLSSPNGVDAKILVKDHEQVVKPSFTEALVLELSI